MSCVLNLKQNHQALESMLYVHLISAWTDNDVNDM